MWRFTVRVMVTTLAVTTNGAMGQTSTGPAIELPSCTGLNKTATWTNCAGEKVITDGGRYVGAFRDGKFHGQGTLTSSDGRKYVGGFWRGELHGHGTIDFPDGTKYVGEFWNGKYSKGTLTHPDGSKFVGEFWDNKYNRGSYTFPDGSKYVGDFRNGKRYGPGAEYKADGAKVRSGIWEEDVFVGGP